MTDLNDSTPGEKTPEIPTGDCEHKYFRIDGGKFICHVCGKDMSEVLEAYLETRRSGHTTRSGTR